MGKRRKHRKVSSVVTPQDVLSGRISADVGRLIELIREVNPQGDEKDASERYAVKSRLQSLLIDRFSDEIEVVPEPGKPELVLLRHRYGEGTALHAVIDRLEVDARAWVRRVLDTHDSFSSPPSLPSSDSYASTPAIQGSPKDLVKKGQAALAEYDYQEAENCFRAAYEQPGGAEVAAVPLLTFLVEHIAQYDAALELNISPQKTKVRELLALAAVRTGDIERALSGVKGLHGEAAGEVYARATQAAIDDTDELLARSRFETLKEVEPGHIEIVSLEDKLRYLRAARLAPEEAKLTALVETEAPEEEIERAGRDLLKRFPDSKVAPRILSQLDQQRKQRSVEEHLLNADIAQEEGLLEDEIRALERVLHWVPTDETVLTRLKDVRTKWQQTQSQAEVLTVVKKLSEKAEPDDFLLYTQLDESQRQSVQQQVGDMRLGWLEGMDLRSSAKRKGAVQAAFALEKAWAALDADDPGQALECLAFHEGTLALVESAKQAQQRARQMLEAKRQKTAARAYAQAQDEVDKHDWAAAYQRFEAHDLWTYPPADALANRLRRYRRRLEIEPLIEIAIEEADWLSAISRIDELMTLLPKNATERWVEKRRNVFENITKDWQLQIVPGDGRTSILQPWFAEMHVNILLAPDGQTAYLVENCGQWLFADEVDIDTGEVKRSLSVFMPSDLGFRSPKVLVGDDELWIGHLYGIHTTLSRQTLEPKRHDSVRDIVTPSMTMTHAPSMGGRYSWMYFSGSETNVQITDLVNRRLHRNLNGMVYTGMIPTATGCKMVCARGTVGVFLCEPHGAETTFAVDGFSIVMAAPLSDRRDAWVLLIEQGGPQQKPDDVAIHLAVNVGSRTGTPYRVAHSSTYNVNFLTVYDGGVFLLYEHLNDQKELMKYVLMAFDVHEMELSLRYTVDAPWEAHWIQDTYGRHLRMAWYGHHGLTTVPVSLESPPPFDPKETLRPPAEPKSFKPIPFFTCGWDLQSTQKKELEDLRELKQHLRVRQEDEAERRSLAQYANRYHRDLHGAVAFLEVLTEDIGLGPDVNDYEALIVSFAQRVLASKTLKADVRLQMAHIAARLDLFAVIRQLLEPLAEDFAKLYGNVSARVHACHLLGYAQLAMNEPEAARIIFERGLEWVQGEAGKECQLHSYLELTRPIGPEDLERIEQEEPGHQIRQLVATCMRFDALWAKQNYAQALSVIDRPVVWRNHELFSLARLALAFLRTETKDSVRRTRALARFLGVYNEPTEMELWLLPHPKVIWGRMLLQDFVEEVEQSGLVINQIQFRRREAEKAVNAVIEKLEQAAETGPKETQEVLEAIDHPREKARQAFLRNRERTLAQDFGVVVP